MNHIFNIKFVAISLAAATLSGFTILSKNRPSEPVKSDIEWNESTHNFGDIKMGPDAVATFVFKNKSKKTVVVQKVEPGCSCTVSSFTSDPVKKNKKGKIVATYKTQGRPGFFKKFIHVTFENGYTHDLVITGNVIQ